MVLWYFAWWEAVLVLPFAICACGPSWTDMDAQNAKDIANGAASLEAVCARDGGPCPGGAVRAMERGTFCASTSMLVRHGEAVPDAGIACTR